MSENFIDQMAKIHTVDPEKLFEGFYSLFAQIRSMKADELICAMQAINLGLQLAENTLTEKQETIIIEIATAMQQRAYELRCHDRMLITTCDSIFYTHTFGWNPITYDADEKKIVAYTTPPAEPEQAKPKKSWFSFLRKPAVHDPLDV